MKAAPNTDVCMHICVYVGVGVCMYICMYVCMYICIYGSCKYKEVISWHFSKFSPHASRIQVCVYMDGWTISLPQVIFLNWAEVFLSSLRDCPSGAESLPSIIIGASSSCRSYLRDSMLLVLCVCVSCAGRRYNELKVETCES